MSQSSVMQATEKLASPFSDRSPANAEALLSADYGSRDAVLRSARLGWWILLLGFGIFWAWASLAPLSQGLAGTGTVAVSGESKDVQSLSGGSVAALLVKEGDTVEAGQLVMQLDVTRARAEHEMSFAQWLNARTTLIRLQAERDRHAALVWPSDVTGLQSDARVREVLRMQENLFDSRRRELANDIQGITHEEASQTAQLVGLRKVEATQHDQLASLRQELDGLRSLVKEGIVPRNRLLETERSAAQLSAQLASTQADIQRLRQSLDEVRLRREQQTQRFMGQIDTELNRTATELAALTERLAALDADVRAGDITAPVSGQVMALSVHTVGGVVMPGETVMQVVPSSVPWFIKTRFEPSGLERLRPGLPVDIRFSSLAGLSLPVVTGIVETVSPDRQTDPKTGEIYISVAIRIAEESLQSLSRQGFEPRPGMETQVLVRTGERTLLNYLLKPVTSRMDSALTEE
jgi:protease secretion system membrane fusion protein